MAARTPVVISVVVGISIQHNNAVIDIYVSNQTQISGVFAGSVGVQRLLKLFDKYKMKATWFIPGHSLETFPEECISIRDAGHEIGLHGYSHENPNDMSMEQQRDVLDKTYRMLTKFCGKPPRGSVAPWWETSRGTWLMNWSA